MDWGQHSTVYCCSEHHSYEVSRHYCQHRADSRRHVECLLAERFDALLGGKRQGDGHARCRDQKGGHHVPLPLFHFEKP